MPVAHTNKHPDCALEDYSLQQWPMMVFVPVRCSGAPATSSGVSESSVTAHRQLVRTAKQSNRSNSVVVTNVRNKCIATPAFVFSRGSAFHSFGGSIEFALQLARKGVPCWSSAINGPAPRQISGQHQHLHGSMPARAQTPLALFPS